MILKNFDKHFLCITMFWINDVGSSHCIEENKSNALRCLMNKGMNKYRVLVTCIWSMQEALVKQADLFSDRPNQWSQDRLLKWEMGGYKGKSWFYNLLHFLKYVNILRINQTLTRLVNMGVGIISCFLVLLTLMASET